MRRRLRLWADKGHRNSQRLHARDPIGVGRTVVDAFQQAVDGSGAAVPKPAPQNACPAQFGNTDLFVSKITP